MRRMICRRTMLDCTSGAAALEFAIVSLFLVLISIGVIDFGRALYVRNDMSYAADLGAREVLIAEAVSAGTLESTVRTAFTGPDPDLLEVTIDTETIAGLTYWNLTLTYPLALKLPGFTDSPLTLSVTRRIPTV